MNERKLELNADDDSVLKESRQLGERLAAALREKDKLLREMGEIGREIDSPSCSDPRAQMLYARMEELCHLMAHPWKKLREVSIEMNKVEAKTRGVLAGRGLSDEEIKRRLG